MAEGLLTADNSPATGETTEGVADIFASVPREARFSADGNDKLARFTDAGSLANSYLEMEKMASGKVKIPTDQSTPEELSAFYQKLGRPDSVEGYNLPPLPEGQEYDTELIGTMRDIAFESGVSDSQFSGLVARFVEAQGAAAEAQLASQNIEAENTVSELQTEWQGDYDKNLEVSKRALRELVPEDMKDDLVNLITEKNLDNNKMFVKFLHSVGAKMLDDTLVKGDQIKPEVDDYVPKYVNSPDMYKNDESEDGQKARAYFSAKGIAI
jgi:hypothetical protein